MISPANQTFLQPAYVLHARPYRDTSLIVDLLTPEHGRITAVARGVRQSKGRKKQIFTPFNRLLINWQGKSSMKLITSFETDHHFLNLLGTYVYAGFYLNELLVRLLPEHDVINGLFERYEATLYAFHLGRDIEPMLREFERELLQGLGYGIPYDVDCLTHQPIMDNQYYCLSIQQGFYVALTDTDPRYVIAGQDINAIARRDYQSPAVRLLAKKINRLLLQPILGKKPLKSRELFFVPKA